MTSKERVLERERQRGKLAAEALQTASPDMDGTALNASDDRIPRFTAAKTKMNMLLRPVGFVCKSSAGRVVRLIQKYDSDTYPDEPEMLPAQWGFAWSTDPKKAKPFISLSTSPYNTGDCCTESGHVWRSSMDGNVFSPADYPAGWEDLGATE